MPSIFTRIINREIPAHIILEDERLIAFLDVNPLVLGHILVVPKQEVDYVFDIDDSTLNAIMPFARRVANALKKVVICKKIGVAIIGLEVPHAHMHLVPMNNADDLNFTRHKLNPPKDELEAIADKIRQAL